MNFRVMLSTMLLSAGACSAPGGPGPVPQTRSYYIAADEINWDYVPSGINMISGDSLQGVAATLATTTGDRIGKVYRKAIYREYTDSTFTALKQRPQDWQHLGYLGPLIRGVVGDTIRVIFHNNASNPYSIEPSGVFYDKASEGAGYDDGTGGSFKADDQVLPDSSHVYTWLVSKRAGPTKSQGSTALWTYSSHVNQSKDIDAGLIGVILITDPLMAKADGLPNDIDRELVVAFSEIDENNSWYHDSNINIFTTNPALVNRQANFAEASYQANLRETLNGFSFGNIPGLAMKVGQRVRWYLLGTSQLAVHTPHWHGQTVLFNQRPTDMVSLASMETAIVNMTPDNPGTWLLHCQTASHTDHGMSGLFTVEP